MRVWSLEWNPNRGENQWTWPEDKLEALRNGGEYIDSWSCLSKQPSVGDRVFVIKTGNGAGIMAAGSVAKASYDRPIKGEPGKAEPAIDVRFDWVQKDKNNVLSVSDLAKAFPAKSEKSWLPMGSGTEIKPEEVGLMKLESMWGNLIGRENNLLNYIKSMPELVPSEHDGSYELVRKTVEAYSGMADRTTLGTDDFNVLLYNSVITSRAKIEVKKGFIDKCHLPDESKDGLEKEIDYL